MTDNRPSFCRTCNGTHNRAQHFAAEAVRRYPACLELIEAVKDFVLDTENGLGPDINRLKTALNRLED